MNPADHYKAYTDRLLRSRQTQPGVENDTQANWCMRRIAELEQRMAARANFVQVEMARLQVWQNRCNRAEKRKLTVLRNQLLHYAAKLQCEGRVRVGEPYELFHGPIRLELGEPELVKNEPELLEWVKRERPELVTAENTVHWNRLKANLTVCENHVRDKVTNMVVPGITVQKPNPCAVVVVNMPHEQP